MEEISLIYVRFDKKLDYKAIVNSYPIKKFCESVFGDFPKFITPTKYEFDRDTLGELVQGEYSQSKSYIISQRKIDSKITSDYYKDETGPDLKIIEFEPILCLDDNLVVITKGDEVLGVIASEYDFEKLIM